MTPPGHRPRSVRLSPTQAVLLGGLAVAILDLAGATLVAAVAGGPGLVRMLQTIAGGLVGRAALTGGAATAALGALLHLAIAFTVVLTFYLASRRLPWLTRHPVPAGLVYGALVYAVMYQIVLPLSAWHTPALRPLPQVLRGLGIHLVCVGLPAAFAARAATAPAQYAISTGSGKP